MKRSAGNDVSASMLDGNIGITPSSVDYRAVALEDLVIIDPEAEVIEVPDRSARTRARTDGASEPVSTGRRRRRTRRRGIAG